MTRVFLADDHAILRTGLRKIIEEAGMVVVGEAGDGRQVLLQAEEDKPWDVLVLDLSLPKVGGIEVLRRLRVLRPALRVVVLSMYPEDQYAGRLRHEGASAYLSKDRPPEELITAIRKVTAGGSYFRHNLLATREAVDQPPHATLSPREYQVFTLIIQGQTVSEIAAELNLSVSTVSNHVAHIREKLSARSIAEIVSYAHRAGLV